VLGRDAHHADAKFLTCCNQGHEKLIDHRPQMPKAAQAGSAENPEHPLAENFVRQGITTILAPLHSQAQPFPMDAYRARVRMAPNVGLFAGHTWIRTRVMGLENRAPTAAELAWMRALVDSSMQQGALGLSTGLEYVPAAYASVDEVVALAEVAARHGGIYVTHLRDEGPGVLDAIRETLEVGRRARMPVQVNHLKVTGAAQWGWSGRILALMDSARAAGQAVAVEIGRAHV
jgi:N-acyl-D-aspartate/D-glutamate deacylase